LSDGACELAFRSIVKLEQFSVLCLLHLYKVYIFQNLGAIIVFNQSFYSSVLQRPFQIKLKLVTSLLNSRHVLHYHDVERTKRIRLHSENAVDSR